MTNTITQERPNVLYVTVDSLRADALQWMPYTQHLATRAVHFTEMYATAPATAASFVGLIASRYYSDVDGIGLPEKDFTTLAEQFGNADYRTLGHSTNKFTSSYYNYDRGFEEFTSPTSGIKFAIRRHLDEESRLFQLLEWGYHHWLQYTASQGEHQLSWWNESAESVVDNTLEHRPTREPWFVWVHPMDPHHPLEPPEDYLPGSVDSRGHAQQLTRELPGRLPADSERELEVTRALYAAECRYWDDQFKRLHQQLPDDTLTVVVGDHGELLGEHNRYGHPHEMWRELTHVPCLIHHPQLEPTTIGGLHSTLDLAPTLLNLAGIRVPGSMRGSPIDISEPEPRERVYGTIETPENVGMVRSREWSWLRHNSRRSTQDDHGDLLLPAHSEESVAVGWRGVKNYPDVADQHAAAYTDELDSDAQAEGHQMDDEEVRQHMADLGYLEQQ